MPFHLGQDYAWDSTQRFTAMIAGTQSGKTAWGPWWLAREVETSGAGDYLAVTATYDLFKMKMLPSLLRVFVDILAIGRYWAGDRVIELRNPETKQFHARRSSDPMWGRIILRSADTIGGLEAATAKAAWLDEAGQDRFTLSAWRAIRRRIAVAQGRVLVTTTLYNLGWVKQQFIDRAVKGGVVILKHLDSGGEVECTTNEETNITLIQFDSIVNPIYPVAEYEEARETVPADEFELFWRGRVAKLRHLVYDSFDPVLHVCTRFPIPDNWERYLGLDFGAVNTAGLFYAKEPNTGKLYCYREYLEGGRTAQSHVDALLHDEVTRPICAGGAKSEGQWRWEFAAAGLSVRQPLIADVGIGINRVYSCHKQKQIIYFDHLTGILDEKGRYRHKRGRDGEVTDDIENKHAFHYCDAERYIVPYAVGGTGIGFAVVDLESTAPTIEEAEAEYQSRWARGEGVGSSGGLGSW